MMVWYIRHPNGYESPAYNHEPGPLRAGAQGAIAVEFDDEWNARTVRRWTGRDWLDLDGGDREFALEWATTARSVRS